MIKKLEAMSAAIAFAEAGEHETALQVLEDLGGRFTERRRKIVLAAHNLPFRPEPMDYALGLASRLHYDTLFLHILTGNRDDGRTAEHTAGFQDLLKGLTQKLWPNREPEFACEHAVLRGDFRTLLRQACRKVGGVELVIIQKQKDAPCAHGLQVPVFCFDM